MSERSQTSEISAAVRDFANALRATMHAGDQALADPSERKILQAVVAESAGDALQWVQSRVQDGDVVGQPLEELTPALAKGDVVGGGLNFVREQTLKQASSVATAAASGAALPAWIASGIAVLAGLFGFAQDAGTNVGAAFIPLLAGGGSVSYALYRAAVAAPTVLQATGDAAGSAWTGAGSIGSRAETVFKQHAGSAVSELGEYGYRPPDVSPVLAQLRGGAQTMLAVTYIVLGLCVAFFAVGAINGFNAWSDEQCFQGRLPDGTCIGD